MSRFLLYTTPGVGHLYPAVDTLLELRRRGHYVAVRTLSGEVERMRAAGLDCKPIEPAIEQIEHDDWKGKNPLDNQARIVKIILGRATYEGPDLQKAIAEESPDVTLIDADGWGACAKAEALGIQWAAYLHHLLPYPSRDVPPFGPGFMPRKDLWGRIRDWAVRRKQSKIMNRSLTRLNTLRTDLGLPPFDSVYQFALTMAPRVICYTAMPFDYERSDWPASIRMVGPGTWEPPSIAPTWLNEIKRPLVLVSTSTKFQNDGRLITAVFEALKNENLDVVATAPSADTEVRSLPSNARLEYFVSHSPILRRAACVICHGGMGITQKALSRGVPVCVVPFGRDQREVARRVEVANAGVRLLPKDLKPDRILRAVREAMQKEAGAKRMAAAFNSAGGARAAADILEELTSSSRLRVAVN